MRTASGTDKSPVASKEILFAGGEHAAGAASFLRDEVSPGRGRHVVLRDSARRKHLGGEALSTCCTSGQRRLRRPLMPRWPPLSALRLCPHSWRIPLRVGSACSRSSDAVVQPRSRSGSPSSTRERPLSPAYDFSARSANDRFQLDRPLDRKTNTGVSGSIRIDPNL